LNRSNTTNLPGYRDAQSLYGAREYDMNRSTGCMCWILRWGRAAKRLSAKGRLSLLGSLVGDSGPVGFEEGPMEGLKFQQVDARAAFHFVPVPLSCCK